MRELSKLIILFFLMTGATQHKDLAVSNYDTEIISGKNKVKILGWDRSYEYSRTFGFDFSSTFLLKTSDSFSIDYRTYHDNGNPTKYHSDSTYNYHLITNNSGGYNHIKFNFEEEPSWVYIRSNNEVYFYNNIANKIHTTPKTLTLDQKPCIYRLIINDNQINAVSPWDYKPTGNTLLSIRPFRFSATTQNQNEEAYANVFATTEINSAGDTVYLFHHLNTQFFPVLNVKLNHVDELIDADGPHFLIHPSDDIKITRLKDTIPLSYIDSLESFYLCSTTRNLWDSNFIKSELHCDPGSKANSDISGYAYIVKLKGNSSLLNKKKIDHLPNELFISTDKNILDSEQNTLHNTIDIITGRDRYERMMIINDAIDSIYLRGSQQTDAISFNLEESDFKNLRILPSSSHGYYDLLSYKNCEIFSATELNKNKTDENISVIPTALYTINGFVDSSEIRIGSRYENQIFSQKNGFEPQYISVNMYLYGSVDTKSTNIISAYPNPSSGVINLNSPTNIKGEYSLINLEGSVLQSGTVHRNQVSVNRQIPNGIYILILETESDIHSRRIILQR